MPSDLELAKTVSVNASVSSRNGTLKKALVGGGGAGGLGLVTLLIYQLMTQQSAHGDEIRKNRERAERAEKRAAVCFRINEDVRELKVDVKQVRETVMWMKGQMER